MSERPFSLAARVTLLVTLSGLAVLSLFSAYVLSLVRDYQEEEWMEAIHSELGSIQAELGGSSEEGEASELAEIRQGVERDNRLHEYWRIQAEIRDPEGRVLLDTDPSRFTVPPSYPQPSASIENPAITRWRHQGHVYLLASSWIQTPAGTRLVRVALDVTGELSLRTFMSRNIILVVLLGTLFLLAAGHTITRRTLKPVHEIASVARRIGVDDLSERIAARGWPVELTGLAQAFDGMTARLEESFDRISRFSDDVAHELRTPISNIHGMSELSLRRSRSEEDYREALGSILEECERLESMIEGLLFLAKADSDFPELAIEDLDADQELGSIVDFYSVTAEERGIEIVLEPSGGIVQADRALLRRAVTNILANAVNHSSDGDRIVVAVDRGDAFTSIVVTDEGSGIEPEDRPRVFDRFYRGDASRGTRSGGSGLGLAIVRSIMKLHNGEVEIESEPGHGTRVTLVFPDLSHEEGSDLVLEFR